MRNTPAIYADRSLRVILALLALSLAACGGGGGGGSSDSGGSGGSGNPAPTGTAEGLWNGSTSNSRQVSGIVLNNGEFWVLYSGINDPSYIAGVVQGTGTSASGEFNSTNAKDFNFEGLGILNARVIANYTKKNTFDGTIRYTATNEVGTFSSDYDSDYDKTPSLSAIAGSYLGWATTNAGYDVTGISINANGDVSGMGDSGCTGSGSVTPRSSGNVYNVTITFNGGTCSNGTATVRGIAYYDSASRVLYSAALNSGRTNGYLFVGEKD